MLSTMLLPSGASPRIPRGTSSWSPVAAGVAGGVAGGLGLLSAGQDTIDDAKTVEVPGGPSCVVV